MTSAAGELRVVVLGSAAGGGVPQWNCNCDVCRRARRSGGQVSSRSQSSIAVSVDGRDWCVVNCSPDIRQQITSTPLLHPAADAGPRHSPIRAVVLTNADVDHVAGLLTLREKQAFDLYGTSAVLDVIARNSIFEVLDSELVARRPMIAGTPFEPLPGLVVEAFRVPGKVALYLERQAIAGAGKLDTAAETDHTVGLRISRRGGTAYFHYIPGCAAVTADVAARLRGSPLAFFDGTVWRDDEMQAHGLGAKTGRRMGHMSMSGEAGSIAAFVGLDIGRRIFVHINNSNPVLIEGSRERLAAEAAGWEIAYDGMQVEL